MQSSLRFALATLACAALALPSLAQPEESPTPAPIPHAAVIEAKAHASYDYMVRPIFITASVRNTGKETIERLTVRLVLTPQVEGHRRRLYAPGSNVPEPSVFDPSELSRAVERLYPGSTRQIEFQTPWYASGGFSSTGGFFEVENFAPNLKHDVLVGYKVELLSDDGLPIK